LTVTQRCIDHGIILGKNKCVYTKQEVEFLGLEIKAGQIILQKHILEKIENFFEKIEDRKQLERFLGCLTYASDLIKDLAKLRKSLQQKLKKDVMWTWTTNNLKIVQKFKKICKNLPILNLSNEEDDLILETDASSEHCSAVLTIKEGEKICKYCSGSFNKAECNCAIMEKEILAAVRGMKKFLIFLTPKPFLIRTNCKGILYFVKKNLSNMQAQAQLLRWQLWLNQFFFSIEYIQGSKNSLADILTQELANGDYQSQPPARKGGNP